MTSIDEFELPKACVMRVIKAALPDNALINKEAKVVMTKSATIFINYLTATANDVTKSTNKKILSANDIFTALETLEFDEFSDKLKDALEEYRKVQKLKSKRNQPNKKDIKEEVGKSKSKGKDKDDVDEDNVDDEEEELSIDSENDIDINVEDDDDEEEKELNKEEPLPEKNTEDKNTKKTNKHSKLISESDAESFSDSDSDAITNSGSGSESESDSESDASSSKAKSNKKRKIEDTSFDGSAKRRNTNQ